jgi:hypothetical protein
MPIKIAIGFFCVVLSIWALGLYFSVQKTNRVTLQFYQWVSNDPSATENDFAREPKDASHPSTNFLRGCHRWSWL